MSTPQNPNSESDANNDQNDLTDQQTPHPNDPQASAAEEGPDADQSYAGSAQYGQGSQFSPAEQDNQRENQPHLYDQQQQQARGGQYNPQDEYNPGQYDQSVYQGQTQYDQGARYDHGGQYNPQGQYFQPGSQDQFGQPTQQGQFYQGADYAQPNQGVYAGSQHPQFAAYGQPGSPGGQPRNSGFFRSLFDFRFDNFIAVKWAGFIYIIAIVVAALSWLGSIIGGILTGAAAGAAAGFYSDAPSFSPWPLLLAIIFGWILPALWVIFVRLALELIVANVKTAENTKRIADSVGH
ncbi:DUF4282 domain-containing protein [Brevibacterium marinum]|uniref:DUF4282 domain-containing protein n=1 Tax=Brevibacterium marinum TaxID=418643 RepID=A0A846S054_9MICO|nr:DUF4282 domain-containing protein [Brevibacterium marinum]NJC56840.1 hypothetical protein [Brevibacterium marinum]